MDLAENDDAEIERLLKDVEPEIREEYLDLDKYEGENDEEKLEKRNRKLEGVWSDLQATWAQNMINYIKNILEVKIDTIELPASEISRAVIIFERMNKGGTVLDTYDLVAARAARNKKQESLSKRIISYLEESIDLSDAIMSKIKVDRISSFNFTNMKCINKKDNVIDSKIKDQYLNLLSIICYKNRSNEIKKEFMNIEHILKLSSEQINDTTENVIKYLKRAYAFLNLRCGIVSINDLSYKLMILPIAYILKDDYIWNNEGILDKIEYWYWSSIFSGRYSYGQNEKCIEDIMYLGNWIVNNDRLKEVDNKYNKLKCKVLKVEDYCDKDILLRENTDENIPTAIHNTILQYVLSKQPYDLLDKKNMSSWKISKDEIDLEDHHIIPLKSCKNIKESTENIRNNKKHILNSILNRMYILKDTNRTLGDIEPYKYLKHVSDEALISNFIDVKYKTLYNGSSLDEVEGDKYKEILLNRYNKIYESIVGHLDILLRSDI